MRHLDEIYKKPRQHEVELPRLGDLAEVKRGHCRANAEAGLLCQVVGDPHYCETNCADCGQKVTDFFVEVHSDDSHWAKSPGPWFMPITWLKRIDPRDPVQYARVQNYRPVLATAAQLIEANK